MIALPVSGRHAPPVIPADMIRARFGVQLTDSEVEAKRRELDQFAARVFAIVRRQRCKKQ